MVALLLTNDRGFACATAGPVAVPFGIRIFVGIFQAFGVVQIGLPCSL
jgi:hypothetical protein